VGITCEEFECRLLAPDVDLGDWGAIEPYYRELEDRSVGSVDALERWLLDRSELESWLSEERTVREVEMTCQTDDAERERRYLAFVEDVLPHVRLRSHRLDRKLLDCPYRSALSAERRGVLMRKVENRAALFREENVPLQTEDDRLRQQYQKVIGSMTVHHDGREQTLQEMARYLERPDRAVRQEAWEKIAEPWRARREEVEALYDKMVALRHRLAAGAGCRDYLEYAFRDLERFDYTPKDCQAFARTIEEVVVPEARRLADDRRRHLGAASLRPWDMAVDPKRRPPLAPFKKAEELIDGCKRIFAKVDPIFAEQFEKMRTGGLLDLASRKGKAPGGYMSVFEGRRLPFIFMNAVGTHRDVQTLLHEGGHAFHAFAARHEPLVDLRSSPIEFAEVASMGMELLGGAHLREFYDDADGRRAAEEHLQGIVRFFPYMTTIDMLQHWVYTHPGHNRQERATAWLDLNRRFGGWVDYAGHEDMLSYSWHQKLHPFTVPLYYVEYGIAQLGALGIWINSRADDRQAVKDYRGALALGGTRPLPDLFAAAGVRFDFSPETVRPAVAELRRQLDSLRT